MSKTSMLPARAIARARREIARSHPDFRRITPRVGRGAQEGLYTLTFHLTSAVANGGTLRQTLRATVDERGDLLKVVTSK
jgi:hypothetical protein